MLVLHPSRINAQENVPSCSPPDNYNYRVFCFAKGPPIRILIAFSVSQYTKFTYLSFEYYDCFFFQLNENIAHRSVRAKSTFDFPCLSLSFSLRISIRKKRTRNVAPDWMTNEPIKTFSQSHRDIVIYDENNLKNTWTRSRRENVKRWFGRSFD